MSIRSKVRCALPLAAALLLFVTAVKVLALELQSVSWQTMRAAIRAIPPAHLPAAALLTLLSYLALAGYDLLAIRSIATPLSRWRVAAASFIAYAVSNNIGVATLSGATLRYRFYTRWGVTGRELSRIIVSNSITFWLGLLAVGGYSLATSDAIDTLSIAARPVIALAGYALMLVPALYVLMAVRGRRCTVWGLTLPIGSPMVAIGQLLLSSFDGLLAGGVLYVLLPASSLSFASFLGAFLVSILLGVASHVPGGVGVFESMMVVTLRDHVTSVELVPVLLVFRVIYYLLPLSVALVALVVDEFRQRRAMLQRLTTAVGRSTERFGPRVLAAATFVSGIVLLFSGATPAVPQRLQQLATVLPLSVIETSHFLASVIGALLLVLSRGLARRLDAAYYLTAAAIGGGIVASLLKGIDYEEAGVLLVVLLVLWTARARFTRRAAFFDARFSASWIAAVAGALGAATWLGLFAFRHVDYSSELWWQFELHGDASRFLRASVGGAVTIALFALARLIGYAPHEAPAPSERDLTDAARIIAAQASTTPLLVFLRDKSLLFNESRTAFVMYAVKGRTWVALGDPVGPSDQAGELIRLFLERCCDFGGVPAFYEVGRDRLHLYAEFGLQIVKLGEDARVDLDRFTLAGGAAARYRQAIRRLAREGAAFRVVPSEGVPALLPELREVSNDWLAAKAGAEKGFSLGFFDEAYVRRFPVAIVECGDRIVAFANLWRGGTREELSIDLMRYRRDAPAGVMEALFVHVMIWGQENGYRSFALGMAPLSGIAQAPTTSAWNRLGAFLYRHGESIYNFQGLRAYKQKFSPAWEPQYLAHPGMLRLPRILADVSALVAGGYFQIFHR